ncbi:hypothetical protein H4R99_007309 [Coemansia sp. RSA 1722]|nr:hypothetical protein IWW45_008018 [Coemansia sp. RSA 485]KAJ2589869.1 hypothetical protein H4R99_007309 [Coemansia sp. RSA 1722]
MTWSPTNRLSEGAVYDLLHAHRVRHVPEVFDSGILVDNLNGYCLEYLVIENCWQTIDDHIRSLPVGVDHGQIVRSLVEQVTECIISALAAGILHCDISSGHIAIKDGEAFVIDWGHANIANCSVGGASENAVLWRFNPEDVEYKLYDALTGDVSYTSIGVLSLVPRRSVFDDIERLFYVIFKAYLTKTRGGQEPVGFRFYDSTNFACTRAACLGTNNWRKHFGFTCADAGVVDILEAMHKFLFVQDDIYVGMRLFSEHKFERLFDTQSAKLFINQTTVDIFDEANQLDDTMEALQIVSDNDSSSVHTCNEHDGEPTL